MLTRINKANGGKQSWQSSLTAGRVGNCRTRKLQGKYDGVHFNIDKKYLHIQKSLRCCSFCSFYKVPLKISRMNSLTFVRNKSWATCLLFVLCRSVVAETSRKTPKLMLQRYHWGNGLLSGWRSRISNLSKGTHCFRRNIVHFNEIENHWKAALIRRKRIPQQSETCLISSVTWKFSYNVLISILQSLVLIVSNYAFTIAFNLTMEICSRYFQNSFPVNGIRKFRIMLLWNDKKVTKPFRERNLQWFFTALKICLSKNQLRWRAKTAPFHWY